MGKMKDIDIELSNSSKNVRGYVKHIENQLKECVKHIAKEPKSINNSKKNKGFTNKPFWFGLKVISGVSLFLMIAISFSISIFSLNRFAEMPVEDLAPLLVISLGSLAIVGIYVLAIASPSTKSKKLEIHKNRLDGLTYSVDMIAELLGRQSNHIKDNYTNISKIMKEE